MSAWIGVGIALLLSAAAEAADPAQRPAGSQPAAAKPVATVRAPLKLGVGDVRKYMMPNQFRAAVYAQDAEKSTIVVEGERAAAPLKSELPMPTGLGAVYSLFRHPTSAWRLFVPDTSKYAPQPGPPDVVPPREFRWGP